MAPRKSQSRGPLAARARSLFMPSLRLERASAIPLYAQLRAQLSAAVRRDGRSGARLPSTRLLAAILGVSRNTVVAAYEELAAEGIIEGRVGSGMVIAGRPPGAMSDFDPLRVLREAHYPNRTALFEDPDGCWLYLTY